MVHGALDVGAELILVEELGPASPGSSRDYGIATVEDVVFQRWSVGRIRLEGLSRQSHDPGGGGPIFDSFGIVSHSKAMIHNLADFGGTEPARARPWFVSYVIADNMVN